LVEWRADDDVVVVERARHEPAAEPPLEPAVARALDDAVELGGEAADFGHLHLQVRYLRSLLANLPTRGSVSSPSQAA